MYILGYTTMIASFVFALYGLWAYGYGIKRKKEMYLESGKGAVLAVFVTATIGIFLFPIFPPPFLKRNNHRCDRKQAATDNTTCYEYR
jgi:hypothetical protein